MLTKFLNYKYVLKIAYILIFLQNFSIPNDKSSYKKFIIEIWFIVFAYFDREFNVDRNAHTSF